MANKQITYSEFYNEIFEKLPDFENIEAFTEYKDDINEGYVASILMSDIATKMMKQAEHGNEQSTDIILKLVEITLLNHPNSGVVAYIGTDFIVSILEYPMDKDLKLRIRDKMGKETFNAYEIAKGGYREIFN